MWWKLELDIPSVLFTSHIAQILPDISYGADLHYDV